MSLLASIFLTWGSLALGILRSGATPSIIQLAFHDQSSLDSNFQYELQHHELSRAKSVIYGNNKIGFFKMQHSGQSNRLKLVPPSYSEPTKIWMIQQNGQCLELESKVHQPPGLVKLVLSQMKIKSKGSTSSSFTHFKTELTLPRYGTGRFQIVINRLGEVVYVLTSSQLIKRQKNSWLFLDDEFFLITGQQGQKIKVASLNKGPMEWFTHDFDYHKNHLTLIKNSLSYTNSIK